MRYVSYLHCIMTAVKLSFQSELLDDNNQSIQDDMDSGPPTLPDPQSNHPESPGIDAFHALEDPDINEPDVLDPGSLAAQDHLLAEPNSGPDVNDKTDEPPAAAHEPKIHELKIAQKFIDGLLDVSLDNSCLDNSTLAWLRSPPQESPAETIDPLFQLSLDIYLAIGNASQATYTAVCTALACFDPEIELHSYAEITGVIPLKTDMCINTCLAFTGPFQNLECGESHCKDPTTKKKPRQQFYTLPISPQLQALWFSPESAQEL